eukprot:6121-Hanusia_phi.AAC.1
MPPLTVISDHRMTRFKRGSLGPRPPLTSARAEYPSDRTARATGPGSLRGTVAAGRHSPPPAAARACGHCHRESPGSRPGGP